MTSKSRLIDLFRKQRPISATTWIKELAILRNFFGFCVSRKWVSSNPAKEVKPAKTKPKPKEPYTNEEVTQILVGCDKLGRGSYKRDRGPAMVLLLRYTGLRISDVATLDRDRVRDGRIYLYTMKNGKRSFYRFQSSFTKPSTSSAPKVYLGRIEVLLQERQRHNPRLFAGCDADHGSRVQVFRREGRACAPLPAYLSNGAVGERLDN